MFGRKRQAPEPFEIPDYLKAVMNQREQVVFARNMNYRNESDLEDMTPEDFENLGIDSQKTRRFMRRAILAHFDPGFVERVRDWQNETNAPQKKEAEAEHTDRKRRLETNKFKIPKPEGEKKANKDEMKRLSMDTEMEFLKFEFDWTTVSLAAPDTESMVDFEFSPDNKYSFSCMKVPPETGFYKAINWVTKNFKAVPFKGNHSNPLSVTSGFMGAGNDAKLYYDHRFVSGFATLKHRTNQTVNLMDVGEWRSVYSMIKMVQNFTFERYFLTKQGYFFRQHILYPGTKHEYIYDNDIPDALRSSLGNSNIKFRKYFDNAYGYGDSMKGDLREQFKDKGVSSIEQFVSQIFLPHILKQGSEWKTEYDDKKSRMDQLMKNKDDWNSWRMEGKTEEDYFKMQRMLMEKDGSTDTETEFNSYIFYLEYRVKELEELMATYNYINGRELSQQINILHKSFSESWRMLQYECYACIWLAFMGENLAVTDDPRVPIDEWNPGFPAERVNEFEKFVEENEWTDHLFTNRKSLREEDYIVSCLLEHLLKNHKGECSGERLDVDGWIYINTQTLIKNIHIDHKRLKWNRDQKHKFVQRPNNEKNSLDDFHSEINIFNASKGKFYYEGASEQSPYLVAYKDMKFRSKFEAMHICKI